MDFAEKYLALAEHKCFEGLADSELSVIADSCHYYEFLAGDKILPADSLAMQVFIILEGTLIENNFTYRKIFGAKYIISGEYLQSDLYSDSDVPTKCLVMSREHFTSAIRNCPIILVNIIKIIQNSNRK